MKKVLITGGSGLIGSRLARMLQESGWQVALLSRQARKADWPVFTWDPSRKQMEEGALDYAENLVHLAGASISEGRWTPKRKQVILESRIDPVQTLLEHLEKRDIRPQSFISASAVGYYGMDSGPQTFLEDDGPGTDFTGEVCRKWEAAADLFAERGSRVAKIRIGIVLSLEGGALPRLLLPVRLGLAAPLGKGRQAFPWIHRDDLCRIFQHALEEEKLQGAFNAVAPQQLSNRDFTRQLARHLGKAFWLPPVPKFLLKLALGEMSVILTGGSAISSDRILETGFEFHYPTLDLALKQLFPPGEAKK